MVLTTELQQPLKTLERINAYEEFVREEGIPVVRGFAIQDLKTPTMRTYARSRLAAA